MSIEERLIDAKTLYDARRFNGALLNVLIAVAATSRQRYPKTTPSRRRSGSKMGDAEAFEAFLVDEMEKIGRCSLCHNGASLSLEHFLYKWLRCCLVHEGKMPDDVRLYEDPCENVAEVCVCKGDPQTFAMSHPMILLIGTVVANSIENASIRTSMVQLLAPKQLC